MGQAYFYHLTRNPVEETLRTLVGKALLVWTKCRAVRTDTDAAGEQKPEQQYMLLIYVGVSRWTVNCRLAWELALLAPAYLARS